MKHGGESLCVFLRVFNYNIHDGIFLGMGEPNLPQEALSCYN